MLNVFIYFDAVLMGDEMSAETIMALDEPQKMKKQGRFVKNFNQELWNDVRQEIVETGNMAKVLYINTNISYQCSNQNLVLKSFDVFRNSVNR